MKVNYSNSRNHENNMHNEDKLNGNSEIFLQSNIMNIHDIRLKDNFKVFISGPSGCGKTVFVSNLLERINDFAKVPPTKVICVYTVWQSEHVI